MGQYEVLQLLEKHGPLTSSELAFYLKIRRSTVTELTKKLRKWKMINFDTIKLENTKREEYRYYLVK